MAFNVSRPLRSIGMSLADVGSAGRRTQARPRAQFPLPTPRSGTIYGCGDRRLIGGLKFFSTIPSQYFKHSYRLCSGNVLSID
jgi:hypothetical protein